MSYPGYSSILKLYKLLFNCNNPATIPCLGQSHLVIAVDDVTMVRPLGARRLVARTIAKVSL